MKLGIALIVLGILGIAQYAYFQFTPLALNYAGVVTESIAGQDVVTEILWTRDWTSGIVGVAMGVGLLIFGIFRLKRAKHESQTH